MSRRPILRLVKSDRSPPDDAVPDKPFVVDYSHWWTLPPPLAPPRLQIGLPLVVAVLLVLAMCIAVLAGDGDLQGRQN
jgi:hypothetical protein